MAPPVAEIAPVRIHVLSVMCIVVSVINPECVLVGAVIVMVGFVVSIFDILPDVQTVVLPALSAMETAQVSVLELSVQAPPAVAIPLPPALSVLPVSVAATLLFVGVVGLYDHVPHVGGVSSILMMLIVAVAVSVSHHTSRIWMVSTCPVAAS